MTKRLTKIKRRVTLHTWRGNPARMFAALGASVSLQCAADLRRAGALRLARFALDHAREDRQRWQASGGRIP